VLIGQRRVCHSESYFGPGAKTDLQETCKLKKIYDKPQGRGYTCLTCTTCHLSYITSLIIPHHRLLKLSHSLTDTILYLKKNIYICIFLFPDRTNDPNVYRLIYRLAQSPETLQKGKIKSEWRVKLLPTAGLVNRRDAARYRALT